MFKKTISACLFCGTGILICATNTIHLCVVNKTDHDIIIAARYEVLPPQDPALLSMPNPFVFTDVPAQGLKKTHIALCGGGRLGALEDVVIRTRDYLIFKTLSKKELQQLAKKDMPLKITIG